MRPLPRPARWLLLLPVAALALLLLAYALFTRHVPWEVPAHHRPQSKAQELTKGRFEMTSRTIKTVGILTGATLACSAMAQTTIYTCNFDTPSYAVGSIDAQQSWVTAQAAALAPGLTSMAISATSISVTIAP